MTSEGGSTVDANPGRAALAAALFDRARAGDRAALTELVHALNPLLWHVVRAQGLATEEAADVVQSTWLELIRRMAEIRSSQALTGWLVTTAKRQAWHTRDRLRTRASAGPEVFEQVGDPRPSAAETVEDAERGQVLWRNLRRLPERCRELLRVVAYVDRPDYTVVAEALGMPRGSIGPTRGRCLAKLRELLRADPAWEAP